MSSSLGFAVIVLAGLYLCICLFFLIRQDHMIFPGATNDARILAGTEHRPLTLNREQATLTGFQRSFSNSPNDAVVLYFGGNAEDLSSILYLSEELGASEFYTFNYQGYGSSTGAPSEKALTKDAWAQYEYLTQQEGIASERIIPMGRSLGSGVAVQLAQKVEISGQRLAGVIMVTPYDSLRSVASRHFPWLPVSWLLRHPFDSMSAAHQLSIPALFLIAAQDQIIPPSHGQTLAQAWPGTSHTEIFEGHGHNDLDESPRFFTVVREFIKEISPP